jgi:hypothetical protein
MPLQKAFWRLNVWLEKIIACCLAERVQATIPQEKSIPWRSRSERAESPCRRVKTAKQRVSRRSVGCLADHGDIFLPFQQPSIALTYYRMIEPRIAL